MSSNIIYTSQLPHTLLKRYEDGDTVKISAVVNDNAHVAATPSELSLVVDFHVNELREDVVVIADTLDDVQAALDNRTDFEYRGDRIKVKGLSKKKIDLLKLTYTNNKDNNKAGYRYVMTALREDGALTSPEAIAKSISQTGAIVSNKIINQIAIQHDSKVRGAVASSMSITNADNLKVRKVSCKSDISPDEILSGGVFINGTSTGFGKTEIANEILTKEGVRGAYIAHTRSIIYSNIPTATNYKEIPACQQDISTLKVVMNSLKKPKIVEFFDSNPLDVVVLDELTQTLRSISYGDYKGASYFNRVEVFYALVNIVANAKVVYIADADANDDVIEFLRICGRIDDITYFTNERRLGKAITIKPYSTARAEAIKSLKYGKPYLAADTKSLIEKVAAKEAKDGARNILGVSAKNVSSDEVGKIMQNPNGVNGYDGFAFTPAISSSFSITEDSFTDHIGLFSGVVTACDIIQMLRRNRIADNFVIGVQARNEILEDSYAKLIAKTDNTEFDRFSAKIEARDNFIRNNITLSAFHAAERAGFSIEISNQEDSESEREASAYMGSAKHIESMVYKEKLKEAVSADKKAQKDKVGDNEFTDFFALERAALEKTVGNSNVTDDDIKNWKRGALSKHLHNLEIARAHQLEVNNKQKKENEKQAGRDRKDYISHSNAFKGIFSILGLSLETLEGTYTIAETNKLQDSLYKQRDEFNKLDFDCYLKPEKSASFTRKTNRMLKEFGLEVERKTVVLQDGSTTKGYSIKLKSRLTILKYLTNRRLVGTNSL